MIHQQFYTLAFLLSGLLSSALTLTLRTANSSRRLTVSMNMWGVQKLGQSIIGAVTHQAQEIDSATFFKRIPVGSGTDDRGVGEDDSSKIFLEKCDTAFRRKDLLVALQTQVPNIAKLSKISDASLREGLLPQAISTNFYAAKLQAAGLLKDWN